MLAARLEGSLVQVTGFPALLVNPCAVKVGMRKRAVCRVVSLFFSMGLLKLSGICAWRVVCFSPNVRVVAWLCRVSTKKSKAYTFLSWVRPWVGGQQ